MKSGDSELQLNKIVPKHYKSCRTRNKIYSVYFKNFKHCFPKMIADPTFQDTVKCDQHNNREFIIHVCFVQLASVQGNPTVDSSTGFCCTKNFTHTI